MNVYCRVSDLLRDMTPRLVTPAYFVSPLVTALLAFAVTTAMTTTARANLPEHWEPPMVCKDMPDGTKVRLTSDNAPHVIDGQGLSGALVTCMNSEVRGPAVLYFTDISKYHTTYLTPDLGTLLSGTRRIEAGGLGLEWGWHVKLGGPVVALDSEGREILRADFTNGRPEGPFTSESPVDGTLTEGIFSYPLPRTGLLYLIGGVHGRVTSRYADGTTARIGYWCAGFPIAKHYSFDRTGKLVKTEDYSESDYNQMWGSNAREILRPGEPPEKVHETGAGVFHPLASILLANLVRRTVYADGRADEIALARGPARIHRWISLPPGSSVKAWFTPESVVEFKGFEDLPPATLRVSKAYRYLPLRIDEKEQNTDVGHAMLESCGRFFDQARNLPAELGVGQTSGE